MTYDANGRLGGMSGSDLSASASYGGAGEMTGRTYGGYNETRTYNAMLQLTHMTVPGMMDMQYVYAAGANNGRITQSIDGIGGETGNYSYDKLNRLTAAGAAHGTWGQAFTYDGFGNLTGKTATAGSPPTLSASFDPLTNRNGTGYDANGNRVGAYPGFISPYDVENRVLRAMDYWGDYTDYTYDPSGKRVKKRTEASPGGYPVAEGTDEFYFYGIGGQKLVTLTCQSEGVAPQ